MQFRGILAVAFATWPWSLPVPRRPSRGRRSAAEVLAGLQTWLDETRTIWRRGFRAEPALGRPGRRTGGVAGGCSVDRPGRMRWDYLEPERKVALVDGRSDLALPGEDRQLWEGRLEQAEACFRACWRPGSTGELFETDLVAPPRTERRRLLRLSLVPRDGGRILRDRDHGCGRPRTSGSEAIEVLDGAGNRMMPYEFSEIRRNAAGLAEGVFEFVPPAGTEIVASLQALRGVVLRSASTGRG